MVRLCRSPIPVRRRHVISSFKLFLPALATRRRGGGSAPCVRDSIIFSRSFLPGGRGRGARKDRGLLNELLYIYLRDSESMLLSLIKAHLKGVILSVYFRFKYGSVTFDSVPPAAHNVLQCCPCPCIVRVARVAYEASSGSGHFIIYLEKHQSGYEAHNAAVCQKILSNL
jgi:hypothetical protein